MRLTLNRHHSTPCDAISNIEVDVARSASGGLSLRYVSTGAINDLLLPKVAPPERTDLLWHHTCFEAFIKPQPGTAYFELNASPSSKWALYSFTSFREGMANATTIQISPIEIGMSADSFVLTTSISGLPRDSVWRVALSAIVEERDGHKSFWALAHPPEKPDFHHDDCFALELPAPSRA